MPAIEYNPRGEKRKNTEGREEDRKRIILENDIKKSKRNIEKKDQIGRGLKKLYGKVKDCDAYNLRNVMTGLSEDNLKNVMMGLSEDCVDSISCCIKLYLNGYIDIEDEQIRKGVDERKYMNKDLIDFASNRYSFEEKKNFLCSQTGDRGNDVAGLACRMLLPKAIAFLNQRKKKNIKRINRKIQQLKSGEYYDTSESDEDDDDGEEGDEQSDDVDGEEEGEEGGDDEDEEGEDDEQSENDEDEAEED